MNSVFFTALVYVPDDRGAAVACCPVCGEEAQLKRLPSSDYRIEYACSHLVRRPNDEDLAHVVATSVKWEKTND